MRRLPLRSTPVLTLLAAFGLVGGCSMSDSLSESGASGRTLDDGGPVGVVTVDAARDGAGAGEGLKMNPLCGTVGFCLGRSPDDPIACATYDAGGPVGAGGGPSFDGGSSGGNGASGSGDSGAADGSREDAGMAGRPSGDSPSGAPADGGGKDGGTAEGGPADAGSPDAAPRDASVGDRDGGDRRDASPHRDGGSGVDGDGGHAGDRDARADGEGPSTDASVTDASIEGGARGDAPAPPPAAAFACQISGDDYGNPVHRCAPAGTGAIGTGCSSTRECRPGLGCVRPATGAAGQCLPFCCDPTTECTPGTFCAERRLVDPGKDQELLVPVCAAADGCRLDEPWPCSGASCSCTGGTACAVVRGDGTTGCVTPGDGKLGEPCPCAAGYYCSQAQSTCVKLCRTTDEGATSACSPGMCQAASGFPEGWGICVGRPPATR